MNEELIKALIPLIGVFILQEIFLIYITRNIWKKVFKMMWGDIFGK